MGIFVVILNDPVGISTSTGSRNHHSFSFYHEANNPTDSDVQAVGGQGSRGLLMGVFATEDVHSELGWNQLSSRH